MNHSILLQILTSKILLSHYPQPLLQTFNLSLNVPQGSNSSNPLKFLRTACSISFNVGIPWCCLAKQNTILIKLNERVFIEKSWQRAGSFTCFIILKFDDAKATLLDTDFHYIILPFGHRRKVFIHNFLAYRYFRHLNIRTLFEQ